MLWINAEPHGDEVTSEKVTFRADGPQDSTNEDRAVFWEKGSNSEKRILSFIPHIIILIVSFFIFVKRL